MNLPVEPLTSIREIGAIPVAQGGPTGVDVVEVPEFAEIAQEIARMGLGGVRAVDWETVSANAGFILRERSKNLRVAAYLAYGLYETRGLKGLGVGIGVIADMCEAFWNDLHPPPNRLRGRVLAFQWLAERVLAALDRGAAPADASDFEPALGQTERLVASLNEQCPDAGDAMHRLVPVLRARRETLVRTADARRRLDEASMLRTGSALPGDARAIGSSRSRATGGQAERRERERSLRELGRSMLEAARALRSGDAADVRAYTLQRAAIWLPVRELPPSTDGRTELPPPAVEMRGAIAAAVTGGNPAGALSICEDAATDNLFWFDAHRIAAEALIAMGHAPAARAVRAQTGALLSRLPGLGDLSFNDGTPFAEPVTRQWLGIANGRIDGGTARPVPGSGA